MTTVSAAMANSVRNSIDGPDRAVEGNPSSIEVTWEWRGASKLETGAGMCIVEIFTRFVTYRFP
jgi:hypothetical protein